MALTMTRSTEWALVPLIGALLVAFCFPKAMNGDSGFALAVLIIEWMICLLWLVYLRRADLRDRVWCEARR